MPTYEYICPEGHEFEKFQKMSDKPRSRCRVCGRMATRKISGGAGLVFKGSGFYITDYGKDGKGPRKQSELAEPSKPADSTSSAAAGPAPAADAPAAGAESKPKSRKTPRPRTRE